MLVTFGMFALAAAFISVSAVQATRPMNTDIDEGGLFSESASVQTPWKLLQYVCP
jgi:hypothetical protein